MPQPLATSRPLRISATLVLLLAALLSGLLLAVLPPGSATATTNDPGGPQTWALVPSSSEGPDGRGALEYIVEPGMSYSDQVAVRNLGEESLSLSIYAQDSVQDVENDYGLLGPGDEALRVGTWVKPALTEVTVPARSHAVVPITVDIPEDAEPGDHSGGIVAVSQEAEGEGPTVQYRVGTRIHIRVAGPVEAALRVEDLEGRHGTEWNRLAPAPLEVQATLQNTGNVRLEPEAIVRARGIFGWWEDSEPLGEIGLILPDGAQNGTALLDGVPAIGPIWVTVEMVSAQSAGQDVTETLGFETQTVIVWAVPWTLVVLVLAIALCFAARVIRRRRRGRREPVDQNGSPAPEGDDATEKPTDAGPAASVKRD